MLISTNLIQSAVTGAMLQMPQTKAPRWSEDELIKIEKLLPFHSADKVGEMVGRSGNAVKIIRLRRGIKASSKSEGWMTANQVRIRLGMADGRPVIGWIRKGLVLGHQIGGDSTWMVHEISLRRWVTSPLSWAYFDPSAITDDHLARLVYLARKCWNDEWLSTRQVADMKCTNTKAVLMAIKRGQLLGVHIREKDGRHAGATWAFWAVKKSDAEKWEYNAPAFDLVDKLHAFMLLARAIGLSNERIGLLCGLSGETVKKRMSMVDKKHLVPKLIRNHNRLRIVSTGMPTVHVHADWRECADQFPHLCRAFDRYMSGRASTDDCYLIARILKVQMAASGRNCNIGALGKCTPDTVKRLVAEIRELGIAPYLPERKT
ncbi:MAG: hypothetical protein DCC56_01335 [Anaerolineae bacterium]|nr:MAG: hypothetical protein DCC56_01335 [Anaerolineae bacterium]WKZ44678.1 MAG: hypothetical protein QY302_02665 [Anaerolineales bacterium]